MRKQTDCSYTTISSADVREQEALDQDCGNGESVKQKTKITLTVLTFGAWFAAELKTILSRGKKKREKEAERITTLLGVVAPTKKSGDVSSPWSNGYNRDQKYYE